MRLCAAERTPAASRLSLPRCRFVFRDMLRRGAARLADKLGKSGLVNEVAPRRIDIDCANMLQAFNQTEHCDRLRCFWHLAQPGEPALVGFRPALCQRIEPLPSFGRQPIGEPTLDLTSRPIADLNTEPLERARRRDDDATAPAFLHRQFHQMNQPVILDCVRQQPAAQLGSLARAEGTEPKSILQFRGMTPTVLL